MIRRWAALGIVALTAMSCTEADGALAPTTTAPTTSTTATTSAPTTTSSTRPERPQVTIPGRDEAPEPPGTVLWSEEIDDADLPGTVHRVTYRSQSSTGRDVAVSGLVAVPDAPPPPGGHPVLAWAHGTTGVGDDCAPSRLGVRALPLLEQHLEAGYVVAATDYEGLGTPGIHPYLVAESEGRSVLDAVRAARELFGTDVAGSRFVVVGHSQGGHAALATAQHASGWAPELELVGTAALAPVTDLENIIPAMFESTLGLALGIYVAAGWPAAHPELDPSDLLTPAGMELLDDAREACVFEMESLLAGEDLDSLRVRPPAELPAWAARIDHNTIKAARVEGPVLIAQGGQDAIVPRPFVDVTVAQLCVAGRSVRYLSHAVADHSTIVGASMPTVHRWFERLLAGDGTRDDCPRR